MAGQQELIIKLIILTFILVTIGVGGYFGYKYFQEECPDGLFVCMGIDDDPSAAAGPGAAAAAVGPGPGAAGDVSPTTPLVDRSPDFLECTRYFAENDKTLTCYDALSGKAGVKWFWSATPTGVKCLNKTEYYKIEVSTALDEHVTVYTYIKKGGKSNGLIFTDAGHITKKGSTQFNMKLKITPLDENKKALTDPLIPEELHPGMVIKDCSSIGVLPVKFSDVFKAPSTEDPPPPSPPPVDCNGAHETNWSECTTDVTDPICGWTPGKKVQQFIPVQQPEHGGKGCPGVISTTCYVDKECRDATTTEYSRLDRCDYGPFVKTENTCITTCAKSDAEQYKRPDGTDNTEKFTRSMQNITLSPGGKPNCNTQEVLDKVKPCVPRPRCPVDCVETVLPTEKQCYVSTKTSRGYGGARYDHSYYRVNKHQVNTTGKYGGTACAGTNNQYSQGVILSLDKNKGSRTPKNEWKYSPCSGLPSMKFP